MKAKEVAEKQKVRKNKGQKLPQFLPPNVWNSEDVIDEVVHKYYLYLYEGGRLN
jgi:hypothetical protein